MGSDEQDEIYYSCITNTPINEQLPPHEQVSFCITLLDTEAEKLRTHGILEICAHSYCEAYNDTDAVVYHIAEGYKLSDLLKDLGLD